MRLRAVFRFRVDSDPEQVKRPLALLRAALRLLRTTDPSASLRVLPDEEDPPAYDADGD